MIERCFFFNDTATTEIYTLSLHDALPICPDRRRSRVDRRPAPGRPGASAARAGRDARADGRGPAAHRQGGDRKSTRLNSSHANISYAVFCLKKKTTLIPREHKLQHTVKAT